MPSTKEYIEKRYVEPVYSYSTKEYIEKRYVEPVNSYFCQKWDFWAGQAPGMFLKYPIFELVFFIFSYKI